MIPVRHFESADELLAHYRKLNGRMNSDRSLPARPVAEVAQPVEVEQPEPPSVGDLLDRYRLVFEQKLKDQAAALNGNNLAEDDLEPVKITLKVIAEFVSVAFGVPVRDLVSHRRSKPITQPRHAMFWLARHLTTRSLPDIGRRCGGRDHTTVLNGVNRCAELMKRDPEYREAVLAIKERLEALA